MCDSDGHHCGSATRDGSRNRKKTEPRQSRHGIAIGRADTGLRSSKSARPSPPAPLGGAQGRASGGNRSSRGGRRRIAALGERRGGRDGGSNAPSQPQIRGAGRGRLRSQGRGKAAGQGSERELAEGLDLRGEARERTRKETRGVVETGVWRALSLPCARGEREREEVKEQILD
ncbi:hypothetical protein PVAP13_9KG190500 [Panicum virgatum]|uniref:Uncharacterized protein n=1 Tax=Panicum virgatum TaxID=38727 RepID=A0A8T0NK27_PANVG|nr:hypothetical protein PVAP13_9KG190500 [Panicum virgatum]